MLNRNNAMVVCLGHAFLFSLYFKYILLSTSYLNISSARFPQYWTSYYYIVFTLKATV
jgi:hypothetical protein